MKFKVSKKSRPLKKKSWHIPPVTVEVKIGKTTIRSRKRVPFKLGMFLLEAADSYFENPLDKERSHSTKQNLQQAVDIAAAAKLIQKTVMLGIKQINERRAQ